VCILQETGHIKLIKAFDKPNREALSRANHTLVCNNLHSDGGNVVEPQNTTIHLIPPSIVRRTRSKILDADATKKAHALVEIRVQLAMDGCGCGSGAQSRGC
jgi:hypothetical protein